MASITERLDSTVGRILEWSTAAATTWTVSDDTTSSRATKNIYGIQTDLSRPVLNTTYPSYIIAGGSYFPFVSVPNVNRCVFRLPFFEYVGLH